MRTVVGVNFMRKLYKHQFKIWPDILMQALIINYLVVDIIIIIVIIIIIITIITLIIIIIINSRLNFSFTDTNPVLVRPYSFLIHV